MINKLLSSMKGFTQENLLKELLKPTFCEETVNKLLESGLDVNWCNDLSQGYLHLCAAKNRTQSLSWLLENGANIESETSDCLTPIFYAVENSSLESLRLLIEHGANVDHKNEFKRTVLQEAVIINNRDAADIILLCSKELDNVDIYGRNVMFDAVANGNKDLILEVANTNQVNLNQVDENGRTILHQKEVLEDNEMAITLMEKGADPTIKDATGKNFLFYAAANGIESESVFDKAISLDCDINSRNNKEQTILMETLLAFVDISQDELDRRESFLKMLKKLVHLGIEVDAEDIENETALFIAVRNKDIEAVTFLIHEEDANVNHQNKKGETVLTIAALDGIENLNLMLVLIDSGADVNIRDVKGQTVIEKLINIILHYQNNVSNDEELNEEGQYMLVLKELLQSCDVDVEQLNSLGKPLFFDTLFYQNNNLFKLLKKYGIEINQKDANGNNVIHDLLLKSNKKRKWSKKKFLDVLKHLISLGIDVNSRDNSGGTCMHKAILGDSEPALKALLKAKADINAVDKRGRSLVHNCIWNNNIKFFKTVYAFDKDLMNKPDKFGILPINYAAFMGYADMVLTMIESGAYINNTNRKNHLLVNYLKHFSNNLNLLVKQETSESNQKKLKLLVESMTKEFSLENI